MTEEARQNPALSALWNGLAGNSIEPRLDGLEIARPPVEAGLNGAAGRRRVLSGSRRVLIYTATSVGPAWPMLIRRRPIMDGMTRLGEVEVARSLHPTLVVTAAIACGSMCLGLLTFLLLRVAPLRMLRAAIAHISFQSAHDLLTGLPSRRLFHDRLEQALDRVGRDGSRVCVLYMDLDHFTNINDLLGHLAGDAALRTVAERLRLCLRASDTLARFGGDEFAMIQPTLHRAEDADALARRLLAALDPPTDLDGQFRHVGLSMGVALSEIEVPMQSEQLMNQADVAFYQQREMAA